MYLIASDMIYWQVNGGFIVLFQLNYYWMLQRGCLKESDLNASNDIHMGIGPFASGCSRTPFWDTSNISTLHTLWNRILSHE